MAMSVALTFLVYRISVLLTRPLAFHLSGPVINLVMPVLSSNSGAVFFLRVDAAETTPTINGLIPIQGIASEGCNAALTQASALEAHEVLVLSSRPWQIGLENRRTASCRSYSRSRLRWIHEQHLTPSC